MNAGQVNDFLRQVRQRLSRNAGHPEAQLVSGVTGLVAAAATDAGIRAETVNEAPVEELDVRPDFAVFNGQLLTGHIELKAPGKGADPTRFHNGHDIEQWQRFARLPNLIYTDGTEWALYRQTERIAACKLPDVRSARGSLATEDQAGALSRVLVEFLHWEPTMPTRPERLAQVLAPLCRLLRDDVLLAIQDESTALWELAQEWRQALFPEASDTQFADAYAQTLTYALLLARLDPDTNVQGNLTTLRASEALERGHGLLAQALRVLSEPAVRTEIGTGLRLLERAIGAVDPVRLAGTADEDVWLSFYEYFLAEYDPQLREQRGVYYTPVEVVRSQVRLADQLLKDELGKSRSFAHEGVTFLDPAVGTGTYPLAAFDHALSDARSKFGDGAVPGTATELAKNLNAFEILVGPYTVAHLRLTQRMREVGATLPTNGVGVFLTDTLEAVGTEPVVPLILRRLGDEHRAAQEVKQNARVLVCMGNPPYRRQALSERLSADSDASESDRRERLLGEFLALARGRTMFSHLANLYNDYVYFWRWGLWKVFEQSGEAGILTFISASSYLTGPGFIGMREVMRRTFDRLWIIDLEGGVRGARHSENVFAITTPVAIAVGFRAGAANADVPAEVKYVKVEGSREEKLAALDRVRGFEDLDWRECPSGWTDPFLPNLSGQYASFPALQSLFPWQQPGTKVGRTWPYATTRESLEERWSALVSSPPSERPTLFADRKFGRGTKTRPDPKNWPRPSSELPISELSSTSPTPPIARYGFRSFDRQWILADYRLMRTPSQPLWFSHSEQQTYIITFLNGGIGDGPAATSSAFVPDLHYFRGRGGKDVVPLWRDHNACVPNVTHGLLALLSETYERPITAADLFAYCYGILSATGFTERFRDEVSRLQTLLRIPLTADAMAFGEMSALGSRMLFLQTYGERFTPPRSTGRDSMIQGSARCLTAIGSRAADYPTEFSYDEVSQTLCVGSGTFGPVALDLWNYEVSGLRVVPSWLGYRMKDPHGRTSSPLDEILPACWPDAFTRELLELLWVLEGTLALQPALDEALDRVLNGPQVSEDLLPEPTDEESRPPDTRGPRTTAIQTRIL